MPWNCYMIRATDQAAVTLRVYETPTGTPSDANNVCPAHPGYSYHNAEFILPERIAWTGKPDYNGYQSREPEHLNSPYWPTRCACGFQFTPSANRMACVGRLYAGGPIDGVFSNIGPTLHPGAMWYVGEVDGAPGDHYLNHEHAKRGPDGRMLAVWLPGRSLWVIDGPASDRSGTKPCPWTRTGTPPLVSVTPSINVGGSFHGWLGTSGSPPGVLSDEIEGRRFHPNGDRIHP